MPQQSTIRSVIASLLLVVAVIGFIPKSIFHDAIATHVDSNGCEHPKWEGPCLHQQGYHCHANDLVVNSAYTFSVTAFDIVTSALFSVHTENYQSLFLPAKHWDVEGRGPPQMIA